MLKTGIPGETLDSIPEESLDLDLERISGDTP